jgi:hypothetical protein
VIHFKSDWHQNNFCKYFLSGEALEQYFNLGDFAQVKTKFQEIISQLMNLV